MNENKLIEVCMSCGRASCWYGEFVCNESKHVGTRLKTVKELRLLGLEHEKNWSDEKLLKIYGESAPHGFVDPEGENKDLMNESLENLLEQVFSGRYTPGPIEDVIRAKVRELRQSREPVEHGKTCYKVDHVGIGYLHDEKDDTPYDVFGCTYCGRCHTLLSPTKP